MHAPIVDSRKKWTNSLGPAKWRLKLEFGHANLELQHTHAHAHQAHRLKTVLTPFLGFRL